MRVNGAHLCAGCQPLIAGTSDINQLAQVVKLFGTVDESTWPGVSQLPDCGKLLFCPSPGIQLAELLPHASDAALSLLARMLQLVPGQKTSFTPCHS